MGGRILHASWLAGHYRLQISGLQGGEIENRGQHPNTGNKWHAIKAGGEKLKRCRFIVHRSPARVTVRRSRTGCGGPRNRVVVRWNGATKTRSAALTGKKAQSSGWRNDPKAVAHAGVIQPYR